MAWQRQQLPGQLLGTVRFHELWRVGHECRIRSRVMVCTSSVIPLLVSLALPALPQEVPVKPSPSAVAQDVVATSWPSYHGRFGCGYADGFATATEWDVKTGKNIAWQTPIPGLSHSSVVVWGERVFVNTAVKDGGGDAELRVGLYGDIASVEDESKHELRLLCLNKSDGKVLWSKVAFHGVPAIKRLRTEPTSQRSSVVKACTSTPSMASSCGRRTLACSTPVTSDRPMRSGGGRVRR